MSIAAANRKITNGFPPLIKGQSLHFKPIEEKNTNIIEVCSFSQKVNEEPFTLYKMVNAIATIKPPTTGSGILNVCKTQMRFVLEKLSNNTQNLLKQVFDRYQKQYSRNILPFSLVSRILMSCVQVQPPQCQHYHVIHVVIGSPFCHVPHGILQIFRS